MRVTLTTMVLAIFELVTTPVFSWRPPRTRPGWAVLFISVLTFSIANLLLDFPFAEQGLDPGQFLARGTQSRKRFGLPGGELKAEAENLLPQLLLLNFQFRSSQITEFFDAPRHYSSPARVTNFVRMGNLCAANSIASLAAAKSTPAISNITRPGFTTATQCSGNPLPFPILVSAGFLVKGLSGKILIQSLPPRLIKRVMATREASIWRSVIQAGSKALRPNSPKARLPPRQALPARRPRCCLRYFTFFGINIKICAPLGKPFAKKALRYFFRGLPLVRYPLAPINPAFHTDKSIGGLSLGGAVVDVGAQGL